MDIENIGLLENGAFRLTKVTRGQHRKFCRQPCTQHMHIVRIESLQNGRCKTCSQPATTTLRCRTILLANHPFTSPTLTPESTTRKFGAALDVVESNTGYIIRSPRDKWHKVELFMLRLLHENKVRENDCPGFTRKNRQHDDTLSYILVEYSLFSRSRMSLAHVITMTPAPMDNIYCCSRFASMPHWSVARRRLHGSSCHGLGASRLKITFQMHQQKRGQVVWMNRDCLLHSSDFPCNTAKISGYSQRPVLRQTT